MLILDYVIKTLKELDERLELKISRRHRGYRNCISPSLLKLGGKGIRMRPDTIQKQARQFFNPFDLEKIGEINKEEAQKMWVTNEIDDGGMIHASVGTFLHALILPKLCAIISRETGLDAQCEIVLKSEEYITYGTADLLIFNHDKKQVIVYDLKTTGDKILKRHDHFEPEHGRQLYSYALCINEMYPDYEIVGAYVVSLCQIPNCRGINDAGEKVPLPICAQCEIDLNEMDNLWGQYMVDLTTEVRRVREKLESNGIMITGE